MTARQTHVLTARIGAYDPDEVEAYRHAGGYEGLLRALEMGPAGVIAAIKEAGLTGRGGAGFPTGVKWQAAASEARQPKYLICNADEGELGTLKDRLLLEGDPWLVLEGITIAAFAAGAGKAYIYIKGDYADIAERWERMVAQASAAGLLGEGVLGSGFDLSLRVARGRGPYIAGEELALLASLEMRRAHSRPKPPYPSERGFMGQPTVVNNVETLAYVPLIIQRGAAWFRSMGVPNDPGTRLFSVTGDVKRPGVYEVEMGSATLRSLIEDLAGGTADGRPIKAVQPGGGTSAMLPNGRLDVSLTTAAIREAGSVIGTGAVIVYEEGVRDIVQVCHGLVDFYCDESCGGCAPCRIGTSQSKAIFQRLMAGQGTEADLQHLDQIGAVCERVATCGLGQTFLAPVRSAMRLFPEEFARYAPAGESR